MNWKIDGVWIKDITYKPKAANDKTNFPKYVGAKLGAVDLHKGLTGGLAVGLHKEINKVIERDIVCQEWQLYLSHVFGHFRN